MVRRIRWLAIGIALFMCPLPSSGQQEADLASSRPYFKVGPGDEIEVLVWRDEYLTRSVLVQPDGFISFPLIGDVRVSGFTIPEIRNEITQRLKEYLPDIQVSVLVKEINSYRVYVIGKVNKPGEYKVIHSLNVMQALALAESFAKFASPDKIKIVRQTKGGHRVFKFNYSEIEKGKNLEQNVELISGDVVVVP